MADSRAIQAAKDKAVRNIADRYVDALTELDPILATALGVRPGDDRAIRVIIDIGMHLGLRLPGDAPLGAGQTWTPDLALEFFTSFCSRDCEFLASESIRSLSVPGQA